MRERAELLGGTVDIHSEPGEGTTLTLKIPLDQKNALKTGEEDRQRETSIGSTR